MEKREAKPKSSASILLVGIMLGALIALAAVVSFSVTTRNAEAAQGRPQPVEDGYQTMLTRPNSDQSVGIWCYKGELIIRTETASSAGRGVSLFAIKDSDACK